MRLPWRRSNARQVLANLVAARAEHGSTLHLDETRRALQTEIQTLEAALEAWDERAHDAES